MNKITFTPKAKKITMITVAAVVCVVLSIVLYQHASASSDNMTETTTSSTASGNLVTASSESVSVAPITGNGGVASGTAGTGSAFTPSKGKTESAPLTQASKPSAPSKPVIQGDSQNGKQPTNGALTNKNQKPAYTTPPKAPTTQKSSGSTTTNKQSNGGSTTGNKTSGGYDPIFGNKRGAGAGGQGTTVGNPGDQLTGDKVGIMD